MGHEHPSTIEQDFEIFKKQTAEKQKELIEWLNDYIQVSQADVNDISEFTAPEERQRRWDVLNWCKGLLNKIDEEYE